MTRNIVYDLTGMTFGRLTVLRRVENIGNSPAWLCVCQCGGEKIARSHILRSSRTRSCGCLNSEASRERRTTHGKSKTSEYEIFCLAKRRCEDTTNKRYDRYGGRGIEFRFTSFEQFYDELGIRPEGCSVDRINNDGHYEPGNVRWASDKEQANNRSNSIHVTLDGVTKTVAEWFGSGNARGAMRCYKRIHRGWQADVAVRYELANAAYGVVE
jgi:hypothetical protein